MYHINSLKVEAVYPSFALLSWQTPSLALVNNIHRSHYSEEIENSANSSTSYSTPNKNKYSISANKISVVKKNNKCESCSTVDIQHESDILWRYTVEWNCSQCLSSTPHSLTLQSNVRHNSTNIKYVFIPIIYPGATYYVRLLAKGEREPCNVNDCCNNNNNYTNSSFQFHHHHLHHSDNRYTNNANNKMKTEIESKSCDKNKNNLSTSSFWSVWSTSESATAASISCPLEQYSRSLSCLPLLATAKLSFKAVCNVDVPWNKTELVKTRISFFDALLFCINANELFSHTSSDEEEKEQHESLKISETHDNNVSTSSTNTAISITKSIQPYTFTDNYNDSLYKKWESIIPLERWKSFKLSYKGCVYVLGNVVFHCLCVTYNTEETETVKHEEQRCRNSSLSPLRNNTSSTFLYLIALYSATDRNRSYHEKNDNTTGKTENDATLLLQFISNVLYSIHSKENVSVVLCGIGSLGTIAIKLTLTILACISDAAEVNDEPQREEEEYAHLVEHLYCIAFNSSKPFLSSSHVHCSESDGWEGLSIELLIWAASFATHICVVNYDMRNWERVGASAPYLSLSARENVKLSNTKIDSWVEESTDGENKSHTVGVDEELYKSFHVFLCMDCSLACSVTQLINKESLHKCSQKRSSVKLQMQLPCLRQDYQQCNNWQNGNAHLCLRLLHECYYSHLPAMLSPAVKRVKCKVLINTLNTEAEFVITGANLQYEPTVTCVVASLDNLPLSIVIHHVRSCEIVARASLLPLFITLIRLASSHSSFVMPTSVSLCLFVENVMHSAVFLENEDVKHKEQISVEVLLHLPSDITYLLSLSSCLLGHERKEKVNAMHDTCEVCPSWPLWLVQSPLTLLDHTLRLMPFMSLYSTDKNYIAKDNDRVPTRETELELYEESKSKEQCSWEKELLLSALSSSSKSSSMLLELIFHLVSAIEKTNGVLHNINTFLPIKDKHAQQEQDKTHGYLEKEEDVSDAQEKCEEYEEKKLPLTSKLLFGPSSSAKLTSSSAASIKDGKSMTKFTSTSAHSYSSVSSRNTSPPPSSEKKGLSFLPSVTKSFTIPSFMSSVSQYWQVPKLAHHTTQQLPIQKSINKIKKVQNESERTETRSKTASSIDTKRLYTEEELLNEEEQECGEVEYLKRSLSLLHKNFTETTYTSYCIRVKAWTDRVFNKFTTLTKNHVYFHELLWLLLLFAEAHDVEWFLWTYKWHTFDNNNNKKGNKLRDGNLSWKENWNVYNSAAEVILETVLVAEIQKMLKSVNAKELISEVETHQDKMSKTCKANNFLTFSELVRPSILLRVEAYLIAQNSENAAMSSISFSERNSVLSYFTTSFNTIISVKEKVKVVTDYIVIMLWSVLTIYNLRRIMSTLYLVVLIRGQYSEAYEPINYLNTNNEIANIIMQGTKVKEVEKYNNSEVELHFVNLLDSVVDKGTGSCKCNDNSERNTLLTTLLAANIPASIFEIVDHHSNINTIDDNGEEDEYTDKVKDDDKMQNIIVEKKIGREKILPCPMQRWHCLHLESSLYKSETKEQEEQEQMCNSIICEEIKLVANVEARQAELRSVEHFPEHRHKIDNIQKKIINIPQITLMSDGADLICNTLTKDIYACKNAIAKLRRTYRDSPTNT